MADPVAAVEGDSDPELLRLAELLADTEEEELASADAEPPSPEALPETVSVELAELHMLAAKDALPAALRDCTELPPELGLTDAVKDRELVMLGEEEEELDCAAELEKLTEEDREELGLWLSVLLLQGLLLRL
jgi:hypothetical protein